MKRRDLNCHITQTKGKTHSASPCQAHATQLRETASPKDQVIPTKRLSGLFTHKLHRLGHQKRMETEQKIQLKPSN